MHYAQLCFLIMEIPKLLISLNQELSYSKFRCIFQLSYSKLNLFTVYINRLKKRVWILGIKKILILRPNLGVQTQFLVKNYMILK